MAQLFADAARAYLSAGIAAGDTTISISSGGALFPVANGTDWFKAVLQDASGIEIVYVTAHTSGANTFTVTRGQEGTTARSFAAGAVFGIRVTSADMAGFAAKLGDAPSDGKTYGRKNAAWAEVVSGATYRIGDVQIAPTAPTQGTWLLCDGAAYLQSSYAALYASIGLISNSPGSISTLTQRTLPSANWIGVAYGNGVFVAIATGSAIAATSPDGVTWTQRTLPASAPWQSIAYGNGVFVAVCGGSAIAATSPDGVTWTQRTIQNQFWGGVAFGGGLFVAAGSSGAVSTSPDGITWTARTAPNLAYEGVAYGNGVFVALGYNSALAATSSDGITWTQRTLPSTQAWLAVTYGNGVFVALGGAAAATSPDGVTWTTRTLPSPGSGSWRSVAYGNGVFLAVPGFGGASSIAATSPDGVTWTQRTLPSSVTWRSVTYGAGKFVIVAAGAGSTVGASAYAGVSYDPATQFAVPRAISTDINSWVRAL